MSFWRVSIALCMEKLLQAYTNEKATQRLLKYEPVVDGFIKIIQSHEHSGVLTTGILDTFEEIEMERIKYFVKEYILTRLDKIRNNLFTDRALLGEKERSFADKYNELMVKMAVYTEMPNKEIEV